VLVGVVFFVGVLKLSGSGKALLVILDSGDVLSVPRSSVEGLFRGERRFGSLILTRLPFKVELGRFPLSPLYQPSARERDRYGHVAPMSPVKVEELVSDEDVEL
jgi:hypothetical protein